MDIYWLCARFKGVKSSQWVRFVVKACVLCSVEPFFISHLIFCVVGESV